MDIMMSNHMTVLPMDTMAQNGLGAASFLARDIGSTATTTSGDASTIDFTPDMVTMVQCRNEVREQSLPGVSIELITSEEMKCAMGVVTWAEEGAKLCHA
jgi:hypothetical protein